ncbi:hypothetical protein [Chondromyces apiculatus]|uniref:Uncharacterized protein n=1 Tax=Chondromyces apiculatus DSM 436 TaxID=1192034 RepID=A0A017SZC8_9BACT|nr:hypothetical protein [Chondromyces apiculatus]EYF01646.1 Hypothetical protein CAP_7965 [Chondromyces apiculatus DSM 436]
MLPIRHSHETQANQAIVEQPPGEDDNVAWLARAPVHEGLVLLGGADLAHFRLRIAQSDARQDLRPSYWSLVGILRGGTITSAPLDHGDVAAVPSHNGVITRAFSEYADPARYPNVAVIAFAVAPDEIDKGIQRVRRQRSVPDLPDLIVRWLSYVWAVGRTPNPLLDQQGVPSAAFVSAVYGLAGLDLTPGLASAASCPESIWHAARWWHSFYAAQAQDAGAPASVRSAHAPASARIPSTSGAPRGVYCIRQRAAAITWEPNTDHLPHSLRAT